MKLETLVSTTALRQGAVDAKRAEALGYDGVLTPETGHDPFATYDELVPKLLKHYGGVTTRAALELPARTPQEEATARRIITELQSA